MSFHYLVYYLDLHLCGVDPFCFALLWPLMLQFLMDMYENGQLSYRVFLL